MREIRIGFVPLTDAAVLIAAAELGFAARHGIHITLRREPSWATLRDRLATGHVDGAHTLAPLAVAMALGLGAMPPCPLAIPFVLNRNGNAITIRRDLWEEMGRPQGAWPVIRQAFGSVARRRAAEGRPLILATVFPYSTHTFLLRRAVEESGIDPDRDVTFTVVPPPSSADALAKGIVDGVCVGSPWNSVAAEAGSGRILVLGPELLPNAPEKVLALRPGLDVSAPLVAALKEAAAWCALTENQARLAEILSERRHLGIDPTLILRSLEGRLVLDTGADPIDRPDYLRLGGVIHRPDPAIADWIVGRMAEAGQVRMSDTVHEAARSLFQPDSFDCI